MRWNAKYIGCVNLTGGWECAVFAVALDTRALVEVLRGGLQSRPEDAPKTSQSRNNLNSSDDSYTEPGHVIDRVDCGTLSSAYEDFDFGLPSFVWMSKIPQISAYQDPFAARLYGSHARPVGAFHTF